MEKLFDGMATLPIHPSIILANLLSSQEKAVSKVLSIYAIKKNFQKNHYIFLNHEFSFYHTLVPISTVVTWTFIYFPGRRARLHCGQIDYQSDDVSA